MVCFEGVLFGAAKPLDSRQCDTLVVPAQAGHNLLMTGHTMMVWARESFAPPPHWRLPAGRLLPQELPDEALSVVRPHVPSSVDEERRYRGDVHRLGVEHVVLNPTG